ncbi:glycosyltransferase [Niallia oryzisoli]|uniref:Glycosyltransferase n=1 Tax=Niallia oryzisoli TaxID=1737571 RepID=A0ABZ2CG02_9BACI
MKKDLLFVINNLNCGGAEKALISLLETIDYTVYNVDLLLFKHEGLFFNKIPEQVNLLDEPLEFKYFDMPIKAAIIDALKKGRLDITSSRIGAGFIFKTEENNARCEQRVWKYISKSLKQLNKEYDVAIGYLEKNPIYYCLEKVRAKKKIGFIHNDYNKLGMDPALDMQYFGQLDYIVTVSEECSNVLKQQFPMYKDKVCVMYNIVSPAIINKLSMEKINFNQKGTNLVSVGRLNSQKGFDTAIEACKDLITSGYQVKWLIIGEGEERTKLEQMIKEHQLENHFILLGMKENPYPYIKAADIYVQPSRFEGKSIAIDEAKILQKPIVVTNFSTAKDQINDQVNGLVVAMDAKSISIGIQRLIKDQKLRSKLVDQLSKENLGTENEIKKLYSLIEAV